MRPSRTDYLQHLWATLRPAHYGDATFEYRPFRGWFMIYDEPAHLGDDGSYAGCNWREAEETIYWVCGKEKAA
jgi:hypothetical protein